MTTLVAWPARKPHRDGLDSILRMDVLESPRHPERAVPKHTEILRHGGAASGPILFLAGPSQAPAS